MILGVNNSSSKKNMKIVKSNFLILGRGLADDISDSVGVPEKGFSTNFTEFNTNVYLSLHYNGDESCLFFS